MVAAIIIGIFIISVIYAHSRGVEKQKFSRQLFDHSTFMAPINMFMTGFSRRCRQNSLISRRMIFLNFVSLPITGGYP